MKETPAYPNDHPFDPDHRTWKDGLPIPRCKVCGLPASAPVHVQERAQPERRCLHCNLTAEALGPVGMWQHCPSHEGGSLTHEWPAPSVRVERGEELERAARRFLDAWGFDHEVGTPREQSDAAYALDAALQAPAPSVTLTAEPKRRSGCACRGPRPCLHEEHEIRTFLAPAVTLTAGVRVEKSKEWWMKKARAEGDATIGAGALTAGGEEQKIGGWTYFQWEEWYRQEMGCGGDSLSSGEPFAQLLAAAFAAPPPAETEETALKNQSDAFWKLETTYLAEINELRLRIDAARLALIRDGYFKPHEISDDIAPRIIERLAAAPAHDRWEEAIRGQGLVQDLRALRPCDGRRGGDHLTGAAFDYHLPLCERARSADVVLSRLCYLSRPAAPATEEKRG